MLIWVPVGIKPVEDDSEYEEPQEPKTKRQRALLVAKATTRKKQVRGKQGRLAGLMKMPIDIFTEVSGLSKDLERYLILFRLHYILCRQISLCWLARTSSSGTCLCIVRPFIYGMERCETSPSYRLALLRCASLSTWRSYIREPVR